MRWDGVPVLGSLHQHLLYHRPSFSVTLKRPTWKLCPVSKGHCNTTVWTAVQSRPRFRRFVDRKNVCEVGLRLCGGFRSPDCPDASHSDLFPSNRASATVFPGKSLILLHCVVCSNSEWALGFWERLMSPLGLADSTWGYCVPPHCAHPPGASKVNSEPAERSSKFHIGPTATYSYSGSSTEYVSSGWSNRRVKNIITQGQMLCEWTLRHCWAHLTVWLFL